jgi:hypothetical protein
MGGLVKSGVFALGALLLSALAAPLAWAHGDVPIEEDKCVVRAGGYSLHIAGYLPEVRGVEMFCQMVPSTGETVLVLDFIDKELRKIPVEFRLVEDNDGEEPQTLVHLLPQTYPTGTLSTSVNFNAPGQYVGIVTVGGDEATMGRFSILIKEDSGGSESWIFYALTILGAAGGGIALYLYGQKRNGTPPA